MDCEDCCEMPYTAIVEEAKRLGLTGAQYIEQMKRDGWTDRVDHAGMQCLFDKHAEKT